MNLDYATLFSLAPYMNENIVTIIGICLLIGAMAKSSQVGLHVWLPMAMEGPTPVSALIHAATMVTAGVYLLMRSSPLIEYSSTVLMLCLWLGAITTVFSSLIGLFQQDIKKVIAYSTMSQLARDCNTHSITFKHQTICVKILIKKIHSQITKAHNYFLIILIISLLIHIPHCGSTSIVGYMVMSVIWKFIIISKQVGISEAIRLILIFFKLKIFNLIKKTFILIINTIYFIYYTLLNIIDNIYYIWFKLIIYSIEIVSFIIFQTNDYSSICVSSNNNIYKNNYNIYKNNYNIYKNNYNIYKNNYNNYNSNNYNTGKELPFKQWLAGLIDGDGYFILTKKGYTSFELTMDVRDKNTLYEIKQKYGGSIKPISNANALRYKLRHKKGLIFLINDVNGHLRNPTRLLQMNKLCVKYNINLKYPEPLTFNNGWLSGFIDSNGSIYFNEESGQVFLSITQKNKHLLDPLINLYSGRVDIISPKIEAFKYIVYRKLELFNLIDNYFNKYPLKTKKMNRINLIKQFYILRVYIKSKDINEFNEWIIFKDKWEKYKD